jgi:sigma-E factor negative regulatory protein RseB
VHAVVDGVEQERVVHLDGERREFLRRGHRVDCEHAGDRMMRVASPDPFDRHARAAVAIGEGTQLGEHYAIGFDGSERVADHEGQRLLIVPRDPYRYGMSLVLDDATSLLLKSETNDAAGRVLERFQFVELRIGGPIGEAELAAETAVARDAPPHGKPSSGEPGAFAWTVSWLPPGFVQTARELHDASVAGHPVEMQTYTDGLAVFAVFVERGVEQPQQEGRASRGATVSYMVPRGEGNLVTVVGEIPMDTAQLIANAVNFPDATP